MMSTPCSLASILRNGPERAFSALRGPRWSSTLWGQRCPRPVGTQMSLTL